MGDVIKKIITIIAAIDVILVLIFAPSLFANLFESVFGDSLYGAAIIGTVVLIVVLVLFAKVVGAE